MEALKPALLDVDYAAAPVFAVLDGAQFDDLPTALILGDFLSSSLYLDRGDNDPEQVMTAPHMVWLDETPDNPKGRHPEAVIDALNDLVAGKPAVVFWQCAGGADVLFKHLRGINMVMLPKTALSEAERDFVTEDETAALFRHADANVLAQVMLSLNQQEAARLFGPTQAVLFQPEEHWRDGAAYARFAPDPGWPATPSGMLRFSPRSVDRLERVREAGLRRWAALDFAPGSNDPATLARIDAAYTRAGSYGLDSKEDIWMFITLDQEHGPEFEERPGYEAALEALTDLNDTPELRIEYATDACAALREGA
ncbi:MAG: DUF4123 domain-containing protein [Pseudomonadota bacterium]